MSNISILETARNALDSICHEGLALVPADIGYGLLGNSEHSIQKMYKLKGRSFSNPCIVAGNLEVLVDISIISDIKILSWLKEIMKDNTLAVVFPLNKQSKLIRSLSPWVLDHSTENDSIAVFLNCGPIVEEMVKLAFLKNILLVGSSGNFSKCGNNFQLNDVPLKIREQVDFMCDLGKSKYENSERMATTILNFCNYTVRRSGINSDLIQESYQDFATKNNLPLLR
ncbi:Sua5/YciO/YrdC/YwlC family protein [Xenorhabdus thailandensis]|uniref:Sua5/YciO/YrdC/YwlC family protein n=1 Tax=Xenorhabdus thailandensis TaxID=3136255 RepID=UPI0030F403D8